MTKETKNQSIEYSINLSCDVTYIANTIQTFKSASNILI